MSAFLTLRDAVPSRLADSGGPRGLLAAALVFAGMIAGGPITAVGQNTEEAAAAPTQTAELPCSEPSPCPSTDTNQNPEVTCFEPHASPSDKDVTLHIYGRHLAKKGEPPARLAYRDSWRSGSVAKTREDFEIKSACHLVTTLYVEGDPTLSEGDSVEFQLQREPPTLEEYREHGSKGTVSDWHYIKLTAP